MCVCEGNRKRTVVGGGGTEIGGQDIPIPID